MTTFTSTEGMHALIPEEWLSKLIVEQLYGEAVALDSAVTTPLTISGQTGYVPIMKEDAAAAWVGEGEEIAPDDAVFDELEVGTRKVAGMAVASNEAISDSSPEVLALTGQSIVRDIARKIDAAFFSEPGLAAPAPPGLASIDPTDVPAGKLDSLDPFADAVAAAESQGVSISTWVANPAELLTLAKLKASKDSQQPLLGSDPAQPTRRTVQGRRILPCRYVTPGTIWGMPSGRVYSVRRQAVTLARSSDYAFARDSVAIRATARLGFGFPNPANVIRLRRSTSST